MNKPVLVLASLLATAITFFGPWQACGQEKGKEEAQKAKPVPMVAVQKAQVAPISRTLELTGTATPTRQARLASPGEGPIQNCRVREGDQVKRGERLVTIGRSGAAAAQVTAMAESVKEQAAELNRTKILVQSGAIPGSQLDTARAKYEGARALLAKARESAGDYSVEAPWDGVVSKVLVKDGDFVAPRAPLVEMYDPSSLVIRFAVPEAQSTEVFKGMPVNVHLDAYPGKDLPGQDQPGLSGPGHPDAHPHRGSEAGLSGCLDPGHVRPPQGALADRGRRHGRPRRSGDRHCPTARRSPLSSKTGRLCGARCETGIEGGWPGPDHHRPATG